MIIIIIIIYVNVYVNKDLQYTNDFYTGTAMGHISEAVAGPVITH